MSAPVAAMLASIGRLKVLAAALVEANAVEAQTIIDVRNATGLVDVASMPTPSRDAVLAARTSIVAEAQRAASERRRARRDAIAREMQAIGSDLAHCGTLAAADLQLVAERLRAEPTYVACERDVIGSVA